MTRSWGTCCFLPPCKNKSESLKGLFLRGLKTSGLEVFKPIYFSTAVWDKVCSYCYINSPILSKCPAPYPSPADADTPLECVCYIRWVEEAVTDDFFKVRKDLIGGQLGNKGIFSLSPHIEPSHPYRATWIYISKIAGTDLSSTCKAAQTRDETSSGWSRDGIQWGQAGIYTCIGMACLKLPQTCFMACFWHAIRPAPAQGQFKIVQSVVHGYGGCHVKLLHLKFYCLFR